MARAKKVAPPASDETPPAETAAAVVESAIVPVAVSRLRRAPENVRKTDVAADVESLADDIRAHGLLQSLIGYFFNKNVPDESVVYIVGGGRRLQALQLLHDLGQIGDDFPVPVLVRAKAEAIELSLSENLARRDMNPADEFVAFEALLKPGSLSPSDLAKRFGFSERYVKQRLRLAGLAPEILEGLRQGEMTLDGAMAYAGTQDPALQLKIYKAQCKANYDKHSASAVKREIINAQMTTFSGPFAYIGAEAYEAAGGQYEDDLFTSDVTYGGARKVRDPDIVMPIAEAKAKAALPTMLKVAQATHPTTCDILLLPGLEGQKPPKPPKGWKLVNRGWNYNWPSYGELRDRAHDLGLGIIRIAGLNNKDELALEDPFFVPADNHEDVVPKAGTSGDGETEEQREARRAKERRDKGIRGYAAILAVRALAAPDPSGRRVFSSTTPDLYRTEQFGDLGAAYPISQKFYVTPVEIEAQMDAAETAYDAEIERIAKEKADREGALELRKEQLLAQSPGPAVLMVDGTWYFRWEDGQYWDALEPEEEAGSLAEEGAEDLAQLFVYADAIGDDFDSLEAFRAAHPEVVIPGDAPAQEEAA